MDVKSGAGTFHIEIERITVQAKHVALVGTIDEMECRTLVSPREFFRLFGLAIRPQIIWFLVKSLLRGERS